METNNKRNFKKNKNKKSCVYLRIKKERKEKKRLTMIEVFF